jgi:DNA-binding NtrC family response regulator
MPEPSTVLVVDDEIGPRESLRAVLKPDYQVLVATEGEQAVRFVEQQPIDVVLLDLRMPGLSGIQVLEQIKAIDPSIEVIIITGYASYETVLEGLRLHAFDYIPKPFNISHLREIVKRAALQRQICQHRAKEMAEQQLRELLQHLDTVSESLQQSLQALGQVSHTLQNNYAALLVNAHNEEVL